MLAALYLLEIKYISLIITKDVEGKPIEPDVPDGESRLFKLKGWNYRYIPMGDSFAIVDGCLCMEVNK